MSAERNRSVLEFHMGNALLRMAGFYPTLIGFLLEMIQNGIDARARRIKVFIDMSKRVVDYTDDGNGVSQAKFEQALGQICMTMKSSGSDLGRFGMGLISPLGKCESFEFISCPARANGTQSGYIKWKFVTDALGRMKSIDGIPYEELPELVFSRRGKKSNRVHTFVPWRTRVLVRGVTPDREISKFRMSDFAGDVQDKFGQAMLRREVVIDVTYVSPEGKTQTDTIRPKDFTGRALVTEIFTTPEGGDTDFRLFLAGSKPGKKPHGKVHLGEKGNDFRVNGQAVWILIQKHINPACYAALRSGVFEGEVLGEKISLHPDRKKFLEDEPFIGFCIAIDEWWKRCGKKIYEEAVDQTRESRWQRLGIRAIKVVEACLKLDQWEDVRKKLKLGSVGEGHFDSPIIGQRKTNAKASTGAPDTSIPGRGGPRKDKGGRQEPESDKPKHSPSTVEGPEGKKRYRVRGHSTGLSFERDSSSQRTFPFWIETSRGAVVFNVRHDYWFKCEANDTSLMRFQEVVGILALTLMRYEGEQGFELIEKAIYAQLQLHVFDILNGDGLTGRRFGSAAVTPVS